MNLTDIKDLITILYSLDGVPSIKTTEDFDKVCAGQYGISVREGDATVLYSCSFNKGDEQQGVQLFLNSRDIYFFKTNDKLKTWNEAIEKEVKDAPIQYSGEDVDIILNQVAVGFTKISMITSSSSNDVAPAKIKRFSSSNMNDVNKIMDILRFNYRSEPLSQMVPMGCGGFNNIVIEGSEFTASTCSTADAKEVLLILKNTSANTDVNYVYNFTRVNDKNTWAEVINNYTKNQKEEG